MERQPPTINLGPSEEAVAIPRTGRSFCHSVWLFLRSSIAALLLCVVLLGLLLHFVLVDTWAFPWCMAFYAMPRPLLALAAIASWLNIPKVYRGWRRTSAIVAMGLLFWVAVDDFGWNFRLRHASPPAFRVACWNAAHLPFGREMAASLVKSWDADLVGIVEANETTQAELLHWESLLPGYRAQSTRSGMLWLTRVGGKIEPSVPLGPGSDAMPLRFQWQGIECRAVLLDITASFDVPRIPILQTLAEKFPTSDQEYQFLAGDFNTPPESLGFTQLRREYRQANRVGGQGYFPTWPMPFPVLTLDQFWVAHGWDVNSATVHWTRGSDHRPILTNLTIATP